jgi:hypothetical protein
MNLPSRKRRFVLLVAVSGALSVWGLGQAGWLHLRIQQSELFLAPMLGVIDSCILPAPAATATAAMDSDLARACTGPHGSAGALVESTLTALSGPASRAGGIPVGYTLHVPLLRLFRKAGDGWAIDQDAVVRLVRTLHDVDRPAIVYLFSTHFSSGAPIEEALNADPSNLSVTPDGPLPRDSYYGAPLYNWTFASTRTGITQRRVEAATAVIAEICKLPAHDREKIRGVTLLGELHHLFPHFETGMAFSPPYRVSDYSEASRHGFRAFLRKRHGTIESLNRELGTSWRSFDGGSTSSKDVRTTPLRDFTEHIDSFAHGSLPVAGWTYVPGASPAQPPSVRVYLDGEAVGKAPVVLGRQDVLQAFPALGDANTGWRFDLDFRRLPAGLHRIDVLLEDGAKPLVHLATRQIAIMDRNQRPPAPVPQRPLPPTVPASGVQASVDLPAEQSSYFYNPLVPLWHAYRGQQVVDYLQFFAGVVRKSCLADTPLYTHQIIPFTNPGWDANKYAIAQSLLPLEGIRLGVSLYGEPTYGASFLQWLAGSGQLRYGVTEFHPLKAMGPPEVRRMLDQHAQHGAAFVSFFLEPRWKGELVPRVHNVFSFDPANRNAGSDRLYRSVRELLAR